MTKEQLAQRILKLIGINSRFSEAEPHEIQDTLRYTNDWMMSLNGIGARLGWSSDDGEPDPSADTGLPDWAVLGVTNSVALLMCPFFDKQPHPMLFANKATGMNTIISRTIDNQRIQYPSTMPRGTGNRTLYGNRYYRPVDRIETEGDFLQDSGGEVITS